jgi:hypothetical protein
MAQRVRNLCFWKVFQTKLDAVNAMHKLKINFEETARFDIQPHKITVLGEDVYVYTLVATDYEASWLNTAGYCALYRDIKKAKGVARDE